MRVFVVFDFPEIDDVDSPIADTAVEFVTALTKELSKDDMIVYVDEVTND